MVIEIHVYTYRALLYYILLKKKNRKKIWNKRNIKININEKKNSRSIK